MRYAGGPDADEAASLRSLTIGDRVFVERGVCLWPIVLRAGGALIGCCGFHVGERPGELELAYHLRRSHWCLGYATEAASACVRYAFERQGAAAIVAYTEPENTASARVLEKLGFSYVGIDEGERAYRLEAPPPEATP